MDIYYDYIARAVTDADGSVTVRRPEFTYMTQPAVRLHIIGQDVSDAATWRAAIDYDLDFKKTQPCCRTVAGITKTGTTLEIPIDCATDTFAAAINGKSTLGGWFEVWGYVGDRQTHYLKFPVTLSGAVDPASGAPPAPAGLYADRAYVDAIAAAKQDTISGAAGQVVGFDATGKPVPQAAPETLTAEQAKKLSDLPPNISEVLSSKMSTPSNGVAGQALLKTATGYNWGDVSTGGTGGTTATVVATIAERDGLSGKSSGALCYVIDATGDPTVKSGAAQYIFHAGTWQKVAEAESMDIVQSWETVTGKPATFPPAPHRHAVSEVDALQTVIDTKQSKITGTAGQVVGFDATGAPVPQAAPETLTAEQAKKLSDLPPNISEVLSSKMSTPSNGTAGQVLQKTATGYDWGDVSTGGTAIPEERLLAPPQTLSDSDDGAVMALKVGAIKLSLKSEVAYFFQTRKINGAWKMVEEISGTALTSYGTPSFDNDGYMTSGTNNDFFEFTCDGTKPINCWRITLRGKPSAALNADKIFLLSGNSLPYAPVNNATVFEISRNSESWLSGLTHFVRGGSSVQGFRVDENAKFTFPDGNIEFVIYPARKFINGVCGITQAISGGLPHEGVAITSLRIYGGLCTVKSVLAMSDSIMPNGDDGNYTAAPADPLGFWGTMTTANRWLPRRPTVPIPTYGYPVWHSAGTGLIHRLDATFSTLHLTDNVRACRRIRLYVRSASAVTGAVVLIPSVGGVERAPITVTVTATDTQVTIDLGEPVTGAFAIRRDHAATADTLKDGVPVTCYVGTDIELEATL